MLRETRDVDNGQSTPSCWQTTNPYLVLGLAAVGNGQLTAMSHLDDEDLCARLAVTTSGSSVPASLAAPTG